MKHPSAVCPFLPQNSHYLYDFAWMAFHEELLPDCSLPPWDFPLCFPPPPDFPWVEPAFSASILLYSWIRSAVIASHVMSSVSFNLNAATVLSKSESVPMLANNNGALCGSGIAVSDPSATVVQTAARTHRRSGSCRPCCCTFLSTRTSAPRSLSPHASKRSVGPAAPTS